MSAPGSARGPRPEVFKTRWAEYERHSSNLVAAGFPKESLGKALEEDCALTELGRAVEDLRARWKDTCCRSRLLTRQVCGKDDKVLEGGHDDPSATIRALLASVWCNPETLTQDDLERLCGRLGEGETKPTLDQLRSTPPGAYLSVGSWDQEGGQEVFVLRPAQAGNDKELQDLLGGALDAEKLKKLWDELSKGNCRLVRHAPTNTVYRVAHACNVLLSRQEWIGSKDSRQDQVVLELYDLNEKDEFKRKGQPPSARLPVDTPVSNHDNMIHEKAKECRQKELGVEPGVVNQSARWQNTRVHARWHTSPSYPSLKTLYFIHLARVSLEGLPDSALFQSADTKTSGRLHYWQWCPIDLVPTVALMEEDREGTVMAHHRTEGFVALEDWEPANPDLQADVREQSKAALRALVERDRWYHVRVKSMHGGKSGSLVVQLKGQDENGQPKTPAIAKIDDGADGSLKKEWESHTMMRDTLGKDHVPKVSEVIIVGAVEDARRAAMAMELAGAAWFNADLNPHCHIVELADLYIHERDMLQQGMLVSGSLAEVTVGNVVDEVFGRIMLPRAVATERIELLGSRKVFSSLGSLAAVLDAYAPADLAKLTQGKNKPHSDTLAYFQGDGVEMHRELRFFREWLGEAGTADRFDREYTVSAQHGDLNLKNIMIDSQKLVWIIDFAHADKKGLAMKDLCKFETSVLIEYAFHENHMDKHGDELLALADSLYGISGMPWDATPSIATEPLGSTLKQIRSYAKIYAGGHLLSGALQYYAFILFFALKSFRFDDYCLAQRKVAVHVAVLACKRLRELALCSDEPVLDGEWAEDGTSVQAVGDHFTMPSATTTGDQFRYVQGLFLKHSTIGDPMTGERLDILQQCASVRMVEADAKDELRQKNTDSIEQYMENEDSGRGRGRRRQAGSQEADSTSHSAVRWVLDREHDGSPRHLLILGKPAGGKTVLLKQLVLVASMGSHSYGEGSGGAPYVPVLVPLVEMVGAEQKGSVDMLDAYWDREHRSSPATLSFLRHARRTLRLMVLLDGMDEVQDASIDGVIALMEALAGEGHRLVLSTRPTRWQNVIRKHFGRTEEETRGHENDMRSKHGKDVPWKWDWSVIMDLNKDMRGRLARLRMGGKADGFLEALDASKDYRELGKSPLLLSLLMHSFKTHGGQLPANRSALYKACIDGLLSRLESTKAGNKGGGDASVKKKEMFLQELACVLHCEKETRDFTSELADKADKHEHEAWPALKEAADQGRLPLVPCIGLDGEGNRLYRFLHLTFQEFQVARRIADELKDCVKDNVVGDPELAKIEDWSEHPVAQERLVRNTKAVTEVLGRHFGGTGLPKLENDWFQQVVRLLATCLKNEDLPAGGDAFLALHLALQRQTKEQEDEKKNKTMTWSDGHMKAIKWAVSEASHGALLWFLKSKATFSTLGSTICLQSCGLGPTEASGLATVIRVDASLTELNLYSNNIGPEGGSALAEALKVNASLTGLNLGVNDIGPEGGSALAEALKVNASLKSLNLANNAIRDEGSKTLAEALKVNASLTTLDLSNNSIGPEGGSALAEALKVNASLTSLYLMENEIGDELEGYKALAEALQGNASLTAEGSKALAEALKVNASLTTLNLYNNSIGREGGSALAEALKVNASLTNINLFDNEIGDDGSSALAEALKVNASLTGLNLWFNDIGPEGGSALAEALKVNASLKTLALGSNRISADAKDALREFASATLKLEL